MNIDFNVEDPHSSESEKLQKLKYSLLELEIEITNFNKDSRNFTGGNRQKNISNFLKSIEKKYKILTENDGISEIINSYEEIKNINFLFLEKKRELEYRLMKINLDEVNKTAKEVAMSIQQSKKNLIETREEVEKLKLNLGRTLKEAENTKKDLVSIMGLFLGIFMFFQLNFSQMNDLTNYDPFNRIIYLLLFNMIFLLGIYLIFVLIDYIVHKNPRMLKLFYDINNKKIIKTGYIFIVIYITVLLLGAFLLKNDFGIKRISKIEENIKDYTTKIEIVDINCKGLLEEIKKMNLQNKELESKIKKLEQQIQKGKSKNLNKRK